jgi:RNA polymerase sigma-70 factor (ECF subfamily)
MNISTGVRTEYMPPSQAQSSKYMSVSLDEQESRTDEILVERARASDMVALRELLDRYENRLFQLAMRYVRDESDAQEILQDVFVTTWRKLSGFEGRAQIGSWLYRVTVNTSLMFLRSRKRRPKEQLITGCDDALAFEAANTNHDPGYGQQPNPLECLVSLELHREIQNAINRLPPRLRRVFLVRQIEGYSTQQAATSLGLSQQVIKTRLHRARAAIREEISGYLTQ